MVKYLPFASGKKAKGLNRKMFMLLSYNPPNRIIIKLYFKLDGFIVKEYIQSSKFTLFPEAHMLTFRCLLDELVLICYGVKTQEKLQKHC